ncbi:MAG TPA: hypothetical protein VN616_11705 [Puia sp.]|nr:hypothetical protein [Puia sp.]
MKNPPLYRLFAILIASLIMAGCRKSNSPTDELPPATHVGLNTMGCYVNGELFIPQEPGLASHGFASARIVSRQPPSLWLSWNDEIGNCGSNQLDIHLDSTVFATGKSFVLGQAAVNPADDSLDAQWASYTRFPCQGQSIQYLTGSLMNGSLVISYYDSLQGIVAGTFEFDAAAPGGDTLHITQGRFDMHLD